MFEFVKLHVTMTIRITLLLLIIGSVAWGQQRVDGIVIDKESGKPVPFASLAILKTPHGTSSNFEGQFSLILPDTFSVKISCIGYESAIVRSVQELKIVKLKPSETQLAAIVVFQREINPKRVVRKAFANIHNNYDTESFLQRFFYRHYTRKDSLYERLIEASVDVWKNQGYRSTRSRAGEKEEMRVTQLRRSLDIAGMVRGEKPLYLGHILQSDIAGYQTPARREHLNLFESMSNLRTDFDSYNFTFDGITNYDGQEVYKIKYAYKKDSVLTVSGYQEMPQSTGSLYITTGNYAFVKIEDVKFDQYNTIRTTCFYRKQGVNYYPYHFIREGQNSFIDKKNSFFHIDLISLEVRSGETKKFSGQEPDRETLLSIPYDSGFWNRTSILKTTPLEDDIIHHLGGGLSLNQQFYLYKQYERNVTDGGKDGEEKLKWLIRDSEDKRILYVCFWDENFKTYLAETEYFKQLNLLYKNHVTFVMVSLLEDEEKWQQILTDYNLFSDGIINYRIGERSDIAKKFKVKNTPAYVLISKQGEANLNAKYPNDPAIEVVLKVLIE